MIMQRCIAHLTLGLPIGGTERLIESMLRHPPSGWRALGLCLDLLGDLGHSLQKEGQTLYLLGRKPGFDWSLPWRIAKHCRNEKVDVLHCHQYSPWFYGVLARLFFPKLRIILSEHGRFHPDIASAKRRWFNRLFAPLSHRLIAVSPAVTEALVTVDAFPRRRVEVVYNGIAVNRPNASKADLRHELGLEADALYVILCARFDPIKWMEGLVAAFALVKQRQPRARLILVGDGPEKTKIEKAVLAAGLENEVLMPGFRQDIAKWLVASDIYTLPSLSEGTSVSLIEAMALGLPAVATRVGGTPQVLDEGRTGLLVPKADLNALAEGLLTLLNDAAMRQRMGEAAKQAYFDRFRPESMHLAYAKIYADVMGEPA